MTLGDVITQRINVVPEHESDNYLKWIANRHTKTYNFGSVNLSELPVTVRGMKDYTSNDGHRWKILELSEHFHLFVRTTRENNQDNKKTIQEPIVTRIDSPGWILGQVPKEHRWQSVHGENWWDFATHLVTAAMSKLVQEKGDAYWASKPEDGEILLTEEQGMKNGPVPGAKRSITVEDKFHYVSMMGTPFIIDMPCELHAVVNGEMRTLPKGRSWITPEVFHAMEIQWPEVNNRLNLISNVGQAKKQVRHGDSFFGRL